MLKSRNFLERYLVSEAVPLLVFLLYIFTVMDTSRILLMVIVFFLGSAYISIFNLVLTAVFYFLKISVISNLIAITAVLCIAAYLYYAKIYLGNDAASAFSKKTFIGIYIEEIIIFLCLVINQLCVKLYFTIAKK